MKTQTPIAVCCVFLTGSLLAAEIDMTKYNPKRRPGLHSSTRTEVCLNGVWKFSPIYDEKYLLLDEFPDPASPPDKADWADILVPGVFRQGRYDSASRLPDGRPRPAEWNKAHRGWYQREIDVPEDWRDKAVGLRFDGVAFYCKVFVNGLAVGEHKGPVTPFSFDVSDKLKFGQANVLSVYVIDQQRLQYCPEGVRGYAAFGKAVWHILPEVWEYRARVAGIWKDVFLEAKAKVHVEDLFAMPSYRKMEMGGRTWVRNAADEPRAYLLVLDILDTEGNKVLEVGRKDIAMLSRSTEMLELAKPWKDPKLWDLDEPNLYYLRARLHDYGPGDKLVDEKLVRFGFRETWVEKDQIYLNGRVIHLFGDWMTDTGIGNHQLCHRYEYFVTKYKSIREDLGFVAPRQIGHGWRTAYEAADDVGFPLIPTGYAGRNVDARAFKDCAQEWSEYIRSIRNHPSVLLYSIQNESLIHTKTMEFFVLQRKLDQLVEELDPTRPYYHDGHVQRTPDDPGSHYENGDMSGNAPIAGGHYTIGTRPMSCWMHEFDTWRRKKPFIYGEAGTFSPRDIANYATMFYGKEYTSRSGPEKAELGGKVVKMVVGCWRSYAVPGLMIHSTYTNSSYSSSSLRQTKLKWDDLATPGPKPFEVGRTCRFNPYEPDNQPVRPNTHAKWMKKTFAPLLVTLYRDLRHNFYAGEKAAKAAYLVNDTKEDVTVALEWTLARAADGEVISQHQEQVLVTQGVPVKVERVFTIPSVAGTLGLKLSVHAETEDGLHKADDDQELTVYSPDPAPRLAKQVQLYDKTGQLRALVGKMGIDASPVREDTFTGNVESKIMLVGPYSFDEDLKKQGDKIDAFLQAGGTVVVMNQQVDPWEMKESMRGRSGRSNLWVDSVSHPLFKGLASQRVYFWAGRKDLAADCAFSLPKKGTYARHLGGYYFEMRKGEGLLVGCNLLLAEKYGAEPEARLLMHNLLRYADAHPGEPKVAAPTGQPGPDVYLDPFILAKETLEVTEVTAEQRKKFHFINLKFHANGIFGGKKYDPSFNNVEFSKVPLGDWNLAGVPFHVVDSDTEEFLGGDPGAARSCIILKGKLQPKYPSKAEGIIVGHKARRLHFLHTSAWAISIKEATSDPDYDTVYYRLRYRDGTTAQIVAKNNVHIRDWWFKRMSQFTGKLKVSPAGWVERNINTGCYGILWVQSEDNPHPDKEIEFLDIISAEKAVALVFAVTLEGE